MSTENWKMIWHGKPTRVVPEVEVKPFSYSWSIEERNFVLNAIGHARCSVLSQLAYTLPFYLNSLQIGLMYSKIKKLRPIPDN